LFQSRCFKDLPMLALSEHAARRGEKLDVAGRRGADATKPASRRADNGAPLRALAQGSLAARFRSWRGASGARYVFSVYDCRSCPVYIDAILLVASPLTDGGREIMFVADTGRLPDLVLAKAAAEFEGDFEFHVHVLASSAEERGKVIADIRHARRS
jgi:hypothetical protein